MPHHPGNSKVGAAGDATGAKRQLNGA